MSRRPLVLLGGGAGEEVVYSHQSIVWASDALYESGVPHEVQLVGTPEKLYAIVDASSDYLLLFHGGWGEGGEAQDILERAGCRFSGSRSVAASRCLDKLVAKTIVARVGICTPGIYKRNDLERRATGKCGPVALRKPRYGGSSIGIEVLDRAGCVRAGDALSCGEDYFEEFVHGTSASVTIVHTPTRLEVMPPMAIVPHDELIYGYATKERSARHYLDLGSIFSADVCDAAMAVAKQAHLAIGCCGITRVDLVVDRDGLPHFLEINNIPGLGRTSNILFIYSLAGRTGHDLISDLRATIV